MSPDTELDPDALAALEEQRDFLLRSLDDLEREHDVGDIDDGDYEQLRDDYTARAAAVLRSIEARKARLATARPPRDRRRVVAWVVMVAVFSVLAGVLVAQASGRREAGESVTGDDRVSTRALLARAQDEFGGGQMLEAIQTYDEVLEIDPGNVEAMTYRGWLLRLAGSQDSADAESAATLSAEALEWLDRAIETDPEYADARVFRAILLANDLGRFDDAAADLAALDAIEGKPPYIDQMVDASGLRERVEAEVNGTSTTSPSEAPVPEPTSAP